MNNRATRQSSADLLEQRDSLDSTLKPHWVWAIALGSAIGWGAFVLPTDWLATAGPLGTALGLIAVGLASQEGDVAREEQRGGLRADAAGRAGDDRSLAGQVLRAGGDGVLGHVPSWVVSGAPGPVTGAGAEQCLVCPVAWCAR